MLELEQNCRSGELSESPPNIDPISRLDILSGGRRFRLGIVVGIVPSPLAPGRAISGLVALYLRRDYLRTSTVDLPSGRSLNTVDERRHDSLKDKSSTPR